jgi:uncharacterized protein YcfJ
LQTWLGKKEGLMRRIVIAAGALSSALSLTAAPGTAAAYVHRHHHGYVYRSSYRSNCEAEHHRSANTGTVIGAVGGGIIGSQLAAPGSRTLGTVLGAGGGAVVGHQIGAHAHRCR